MTLVETILACVSSALAGSSVLAVWVRAKAGKQAADDAWYRDQARLAHEECRRELAEHRGQIEELRTRLDQSEERAVRLSAELYELRREIDSGARRR